MKNAANAQLAILLSCLTIFIGCQRRESKKDYLARVGDSYLTMETVETLTDSVTRSSAIMLREYIHRWINNELLYQEARRQGMENSETFQRQLAEVRKQLAIEALLSKELYGDTVGIAEDSIRSYFDNHREDFLLQQNIVKVNMVVFASREKANAFRAQIVASPSRQVGIWRGGLSWQSALQTMHADTASQPLIMTQVERRYYTQQTLFPPELWRVAINLAPDEVSFPVRTQGGFVIIQLLSVLRQGMPSELDMVQDEIRQRLLIERRRQQYTDLLARLRSQHEIEVTAP